MKAPLLKRAMLISTLMVTGLTIFLALLTLLIRYLSLHATPLVSGAVGLVLLWLLATTLCYFDIKDEARH